MPNSPPRRPSSRSGGESLVVTYDRGTAEHAPADSAGPCISHRERLREVNAKRHYIRSPIDERSPWVLFQDAPAVRAKVTHRLYEAARPLQDVKPDPPEVVQAFIDEEHAETTYHPRYHGLYHHRHLTPGAPGGLGR